MSLKVPTILRLVALRNAGLSCAAAAAVVNLDERRAGDSCVTGEQVRRYTVQFGVAPRADNRALRVTGIENRPAPQWRQWS